MIIPCFRCGKELNSPSAFNADYILASDTIVREPREVLVALKHNQKTLEKPANAKSGGIETAILDIDDSEYDAVEVPSVTEAGRNFGDDLVKVIAQIKDKDIQKTGIICPDCYKPTDFVIWGPHKRQE